MTNAIRVMIVFVVLLGTLLAGAALGYNTGLKKGQREGDAQLLTMSKSVRAAQIHLEDLARMHNDAAERMQKLQAALQN